MFKQGTVLLSRIGEYPVYYMVFHIRHFSQVIKLLAVRSDNRYGFIISSQIMVPGKRYNRGIIKITIFATAAVRSGNTRFTP